MSLLKKLFGIKKQNQPIRLKKYFIRYAVDGNLLNVYYYECMAVSESDARYDFWDCHNELYHDILSVNETPTL